MKYFVLVFIVVYFVSQTKGEEFVCQKGVPYIENECNSCLCATNKLTCTYKGCNFPEGKRHELYDCKLGTTFMKDCNKCWCVKDLGTICSNLPC